MRSRHVSTLAVIGVVALAATACSPDAAAVSTYTVPENHTDVGVELTVVTDGDCLVADHEGQRVQVAFPDGATRDDDEVSLPDGRTVQVGERSLVGGTVVDQSTAGDEYALRAASGCTADRWFLLW
ncbi:hypothetical protein [uncultured Tessaracoccus sp.]|uniref:hypothetical protein n=1 Tax=uncultured Tessaracoccus sp. TaxID=905023 RepID=UPI0025FCE7D6|nr:hypothetical protein [uncultured Tessaracoccus sp.]